VGIFVRVLMLSQYLTIIYDRIVFGTKRTHRPTRSYPMMQGSLARSLTGTQRVTTLPRPRMGEFLVQIVKICVRWVDTTPNSVNL
jgi:hypothetical protein